MEYSHIDKIETADTGGHCMVDLIHLKDGRVLGISTDVIVLYPSIESFDDGGDEDLPYIELYL